MEALPSLLGLAGASLALLSRRFARRDVERPRGRQLLWFPIWKQQRLFRKPGYEMFVLGILCLCVSLILAIL